MTVEVKLILDLSLSDFRQPVDHVVCYCHVENEACDIKNCVMRMQLGLTQKADQM